MGPVWVAVLGNGLNRYPGKGALIDRYAGTVRVAQGPVLLEMRDMPRSLGYLGIVFAAVIWSMTCPAKAQATEAYAAATGQECRVCHIDPLGGGTLTEQGKGYILSISSARNEEPQRKQSLSVVIRMVFRYLHHFRVRGIYIEPADRL